MPQPFSQILYEVEDRIATITLNRPEKLNAFTETMLQWQRLEVLQLGPAAAVGSPAGGEGLRSMLIFTAQSKVLTPDWVTPEGVNVWGVTWQKAHAISPNLSPEILH